MIKLIKQTVSEFQQDQCPRMAAALAYYTIFSLAPLMILLIMICGVVWNPSDVERLMATELRSVIGEDGAEQLKTMLQNASLDKGGVQSSIISAIMLLFGATGLVGQLQTALNDAWQVKPDPERGGIWTFVTKRLLSVAMICSIAFLLLVSLVASSVLSAMGDTIAQWLPQNVSQTLLMSLNLGISFFTITLMFAAMFKFLPDADIAWSDVIVGALATAALFVVGKYGVGVYLGSRNMDSVYGSAGSLALILVWVYYSSMIFLFGAELTQVWARERGTGVKPSEGAIRVVRKSVYPSSSLA